MKKHQITMWGDPRCLRSNDRHWKINYIFHTKTPVTLEDIFLGGSKGYPYCGSPRLWEDYPILGYLQEVQVSCTTSTR